MFTKQAAPPPPNFGAIRGAMATKAYTAAQRAAQEARDLPPWWMAAPFWNTSGNLPVLRGSAALSTIPGRAAAPGAQKLLESAESKAFANAIPVSATVGGAPYGGRRILPDDFFTPPPIRSKGWGARAGEHVRNNAWPYGAAAGTAALGGGLYVATEGQRDRPGLASTLATDGADSGVSSSSGIAKALTGQQDPSKVPGDLGQSLLRFYETVGPTGLAVGGGLAGTLAGLALGRGEDVGEDEEQRKRRKLKNLVLTTTLGLAGAGGAYALKNVANDYLTNLNLPKPV